MAKAYLNGDYALSNVGEYFDVSYATVSRAVKSYEGELSMSNVRPDPETLQRKSLKNMRRRQHE